MSNKVNVYDEDGQIVARVNYNSNLDSWDGRNWGIGNHSHAGLTRLKSGEYVIIHSSDYQGTTPHGEIISKNEALDWILKADISEELLALSKFSELKAMADRLDEQEETD